MDFLPSPFPLEAAALLGEAAGLLGEAAADFLGEAAADFLGEAAADFLGEASADFLGEGRLLGEDRGLRDGVAGLSCLSLRDFRTFF